MSSEEDSAQLMATFKRKDGRKAAPQQTAAPSAFPPGAFVSEQSKPADEDASPVQPPPRTRRAICVRVKPIANKAEYTYIEPKDEVEGILREFHGRRGDMLYEVRLFGDKTKQVSESFTRK
jgi:hypothetical protein